MLGVSGTVVTGSPSRLPVLLNVYYCAYLQITYILYNIYALSYRHGLTLFWIPK